MYLIFINSYDLHNLEVVLLSKNIVKNLYIDDLKKNILNFFYEDLLIYII